MTSINDNINAPAPRLSDQQARDQYFSSWDERAAEALEARLEGIAQARMVIGFSPSPGPLMVPSVRKWDQLKKWVEFADKRTQK